MVTIASTIKTNRVNKPAHFSMLTNGIWGIFASACIISKKSMKKKEHVANIISKTAYKIHITINNRREIKG
jgi:hypothetical protein